jgi:hypothetical protein
MLVNLIIFKIGGKKTSFELFLSVLAIKDFGIKHSFRGEKNFFELFLSVLVRV